jgi:hypothetical protein
MSGRNSEELSAAKTCPLYVLMQVDAGSSLAKTLDLN